MYRPYEQVYTTLTLSYLLKAESIHQRCGAEILIVMTKGNIDDMFKPFLWATERAQYYWSVIAGQDMVARARMQEACAVAMMDGTS